MNNAPIRPMLDDFELPLVQVLRTEEDQVWVDHAVPARDGSLLQRLNRAATRIFVQGVLASDRSLDHLERLRELFQRAEPMPFVADIMTATAVTQVLLEDLVVRELAGKPQCYTYALDLVEYVPTTDPPAPIRPPPPLPPPPPPECPDRTGRIEVTVILPAGQTDYTGVVVRLQRTGDSTAPPIELTDQVDGVYAMDNLPAGEYRATALRRP